MSCRTVAAALAAGFALFASACASGGSETGSQGSDGKFDQTWPKPYNQTTCAEWNNEMSQNENFVAAADILVGARSVDAADSGLPNDDLINTFRDGITTACVVPTAKVNEIGVVLYLTERVTFKP